MGLVRAAICIRIVVGCGCVGSEVCTEVRSVRYLPAISRSIITESQGIIIIWIKTNVHPYNREEKSSDSGIVYNFRPPCGALSSHLKGFIEAQLVSQPI